jgi:hypothetical protein
MARINADAVKKSRTVPSGAEVLVTLPGNNDVYKVDRDEFLRETGVTPLVNASLYAETAIDTTAISNMHSVEVPILPAPGVNKYYVIKDIVVEGHWTAGFNWTVGNGIYLKIYEGALESIETPLWAIEAQSLLEFQENRVANPVQTGLQSTIDAVVRDSHNAQRLTNLNSGLNAKLSGSVTDGTNTLLVKVWYEVRTFGSEL